MNEGYTWVVDIYLVKYFDTVKHDKLMFLIAKEVEDKRVKANKSISKIRSNDKRCSNRNRPRL